MTETVVTRCHVRPAIAGAAIPDPERGRDLPAGGIEVDWSPYWARLAASGDVVATSVAPEPEPAPAPEPEPASRRGARR